MSLFISGSSGPATSLTLGDAERQVARVVGEHDDPSSVGAREAIQQVIRRISGENWDFLQVQADDITLYDHATRTLGQEGYAGQYTIPTPFRDFISAYVVFGADPGYPLQYEHRINYDKVIAGQTGTGPFWISFFPFGDTGKAEIMDPPTQSGLLKLRYWRPLTIPTDPTQALDLPIGPLETAVIELAKAIVANDKGETRKGRLHREDGERDLGKARMADRVHMAGDHRFLPEHTWANQPFRRFDGWGTP